MDPQFKLLYIDDEAINLFFFEMKFRNSYKVITAKNGMEGLEILEDNPDILLIISDMNMPGMTGLEFIYTAKEKYPEKKFFILTGYEITEEIKKALLDGLIIKYFSKPYREEDIESVLSTVIETEIRDK